MQSLETKSSRPRPKSFGTQTRPETFETETPKNGLETDPRPSLETPSLKTTLFLLICEENFFLRTSHPPKSAANFTLVVWKPKQGCLGFQISEICPYFKLVGRTIFGLAFWLFWPFFEGRLAENVFCWPFLKR